MPHFTIIVIIRLCIPNKYVILSFCFVVVCLYLCSHSFSHSNSYPSAFNYAFAGVKNNNIYCYDVHHHQPPPPNTTANDHILEWRSVGFGICTRIISSPVANLSFSLLSKETLGIVIKSYLYFYRWGWQRSVFNIYIFISFSLSSFYVVHSYFLDSSCISLIWFRSVSVFKIFN